MCCDVWARREPKREYNKTHCENMMLKRGRMREREQVPELFCVDKNTHFLDNSTRNKQATRVEFRGNESFILISVFYLMLKSARSPNHRPS